MNQKLVPSFPIPKIQLSIFAIWLVTISGMIGITFGYGDWFLCKTPFNLMLGLVLLYWNFPAKNGWRSMALWSLVFLMGIIAEIIGVNTSLLFGNYYYGNNLGFKVFGVPLLIGVNWVLLIFSSATISHRFIHNKWLAILGSALLMVGLDFFIEPVASRFDFWHWEAGYAPMRNFIDWFLLALLMNILVQNDLPKENHPLPLHYFASLVLFFIFFYAVYSF
jgi:putative membrane protein